MSVPKKKAVKNSNLVKRSSTPIYRHSAPTIYDHAEQGRECVVAKKDLYIQTSQDENSPCWVLMGPYTPPQVF